MFEYRFYLLLIFILLGLFSCTTDQTEIDCYELVNRHNVQINGCDSLNALSVGNGNFTFTAGLTGLQTFYEAYENGAPMGTQSNWGWHSFRNNENFTRKTCYSYNKYREREVAYLVGKYDTKRKEEVTEHFLRNPIACIWEL